MSAATKLCHTIVLDNISYYFSGRVPFVQTKNPLFLNKTVSAIYGRNTTEIAEFHWVAKQPAVPVSLASDQFKSFIKV